MLINTQLKQTLSYFNLINSTAIYGGTLARADLISPGTVFNTDRKLQANKHNCEQVELVFFSDMAMRRLATEYWSVYRFRDNSTFLRPLQISQRNLSASGGEKDAGKKPFDVSLLEFLVCPLSKKPLRYAHYTRLSH